MKAYKSTIKTNYLHLAICFMMCSISSLSLYAETVVCPFMCILPVDNRVLIFSFPEPPGVDPTKSGSFFNAGKTIGYDIFVRYLIHRLTIFQSCWDGLLVDKYILSLLLTRSPLDGAGNFKAAMKFHTKLTFFFDIRKTCPCNIKIFLKL